MALSWVSTDGFRSPVVTAISLACQLTSRRTSRLLCLRVDSQAYKPTLVRTSRLSYLRADSHAYEPAFVRTSQSSCAQAGCRVCELAVAPSISRISTECRTYDSNHSTLSTGRVSRHVSVIPAATVLTQLSFHRHYAVSTPADKARKVTIVGCGTIGLSFAALHLTRNPLCVVKVWDPREDLGDYVKERLPQYLAPAKDSDIKACQNRVEIAKSLADAVKDANIVQEQGPENRQFKADIWAEIEQSAHKDALFWSSTSGISASEQSAKMRDDSRVLVVHPFNPPHIMPLLEVVPAPKTKADVVQRTIEYWEALGRTPVVMRRECPGFVANRLAFALFREACSLVHQGVIDVKDLDAVVTSSLGPRFAVAGPFKSYHAGGGSGGLAAFMEKIGSTIQESWDAGDKDIRKGDINLGKAWQDDICRQSDEAYGGVNTAERDRVTREVLKATGKC